MSQPVMAAFAGAETLSNSGVATPAADARLLLAHAMEVDLPQLFLAGQVTPQQQELFEKLLEQRCQGIPVQHLTGQAHFRYETLLVGPGVFIPRPETELLVDFAIKVLSARESQRRRVIELCAGSGAISRSLVRELGSVRVVAVEQSEQALPFLRRNLADTSVEIVAGDFGEVYRRLEPADLVIANPPYVPTGLANQLPSEVGFDPPEAVFAGQDGLEVIRKLAQITPELLVPDGMVVLEHDESHADQVRQLFAPEVLAGNYAPRSLAPAPISDRALRHMAG